MYKSFFFNHNVFEDAPSVFNNGRVVLGKEKARHFLNHTVSESEAQRGFQDAPSVLKHGRVCGLEKPLHFLNHTVSESNLI